jgi:hypothetical protein
MGQSQFLVAVVPGHKTTNGGCSWCSRGHGWDSLSRPVPVVAVTRAAGPPNVPSSRRTRPVHALSRCAASGRLTPARRDSADHPSAHGPLVVRPGPCIEHSHQAWPGTGSACSALARPRRLCGSACRVQPGRASATCAISAARRPPAGPSPSLSVVPSIDVFHYWPGTRMYRN